MTAEAKVDGPPARSERRLFLGAAALIGLALLLGGQANGKAGQEMVIQLAALFVIVSATAGARIGDDPVVRAAKYVIFATIGLTVLHLIPLPYSLWAALSPVPTAQSVLEQLGLAHGWRPFSLDPAETFDNLLLLLPPVAMFFAMLRLSSAGRAKLAFVVLVLAAVSAAVGLLQYGSGTQSLSFYEQTNLGFGTGFFSNRNHQADLAVVGWLLAAVVVASPISPTSRFGGNVQLVFLLVATLLFVLAILATGSRGGFLFAGFAALAIVVLRFSGSAGKLFGAIVAAGGLGALALIAAASSGSTLFTETVERFSNDDEARLIIWPRVAELLPDVMPLGAGIGSFVEYYRFSEPLGMVGRRYVNSAHNEYLEIALDAGIPGLLIVVAAFAVLAWAGKRALGRGLGKPGDYRRLQAAAAVGILVLLAHSSFDYPLRTTGLAVVFAFLCGLLMPMRADSTKAVADRA